MKRYGNIYSKIYDMENLREAHRCARRGKGYYSAVRMVDRDGGRYLVEIQDMLKKGTYTVKAEDYMISVINDKGKERELWKLAYFPHRIIQWAIMLQIEHIFMKTFCYHTCASIKGRGIKHAYTLTKEYLQDKENTKYCLKIDIRKFYPNIDHGILKRLLRKKFKDARLLQLLDMIIDSYPGEKGVPIGSYLSQFLANFYLAYFDHWLKEVKGVKRVVRYMDDVVIFHSSKEFLHSLLREIQEYLNVELKLRVKGNWQIFPVDSRGVDFIGYRFFHGYVLLRKRICIRFKRAISRLRTTLRHDMSIPFTVLCSLNAYQGWLSWCNSWRLKKKYLNKYRNLLF